jgi:hypothetical protein
MAPSVVAGQRGKQQWLHGVSSAPATTADIDALGSLFPPLKVEFLGKCEEEGPKKLNEKTAIFGFSCNLAYTYTNLLQWAPSHFVSWRPISLFS